MERGALLQKLATLIDENTETLAHLLTAEGGKLLPESRIDANFAATPSLNSSSPLLSPTYPQMHPCWR